MLETNVRPLYCSLFVCNCIVVFNVSYGSFTGPTPLGYVVHKVCLTCTVTIATMYSCEQHKINRTQPHMSTFKIGEVKISINWTTIIVFEYFTMHRFGERLTVDTCRERRSAIPMHIHLTLNTLNDYIMHNMETGILRVDMTAICSNENGAK